MLTRRRLLYGGASAITAAAYPIVLEPRWFDVTVTKVPASGSSDDSIRVLHLTDLHASWAVSMSQINSAIEVGLAGNPDLVCITGDFITHRYDFDARSYVTALRRLTATRPAFAVLGNHDGGAWAKERRGYADHIVVERILEEAGIHLLHNRSIQAEVRDHRFTLVGVGDLWSNELIPDKAFASVERESRLILLSHNPDGKEILRSYQWDLMLCGHTHGGQVMIPFEGPTYAPVRDKRFVAGLHKWDGRQIYVSRGVGNLGSVRFLCRPEVTLLDLEVG